MDFCSTISCSKQLRFCMTACKSVIPLYSTLFRNVFAALVDTCIDILTSMLIIYVVLKL